MGIWLGLCVAGADLLPWFRRSEDLNDSDGYQLDVEDVGDWRGCWLIERVLI